MKDPRNIVAILLAATVCIVILSASIAALLYPPGTVSETFRAKLFELLIYLMGIVSGWLLGREKKE